MRRPPGLDVVRYLRTEGICLRRVDYSNTSQVATFLTRDAGRVSLMAKGVKRAPKKGVRRGFDLACVYDLVFLPRRRGSLHLLSDRLLVEGFAGMRRSLERQLCGYYAAELVLNLTIEDEQEIDEARRARLPVSMIVLTADNRVLVRSAAVVHILARLGGPWRVVAGALWLAPKPLGDLAYRAVAALRRHIFATPTDLCPVVRPEWRDRFRG